MIVRQFLIVFILFFRAFLYAEVVQNTVQQADEIIVVSSRYLDSTSGSILFENKVDTSGKLGYYLVKTFYDDSMCISIVDSSFFLSQLKTGYNNWVLFVHGDSKTFEEAVLRGIKIKKTHNVNVVVFSWPSKENGINGAKNFRKSKRHVESSLAQFSSLVQTIKYIRASEAFLINRKISLFIHSLGNYFLELFVEKNIIPESPIYIFDNIIINAAAVNQKYHKNWLKKLQIQKQIYVISNRHDFNLKGVRIFTSGGKQLGEIVKAPFSENACYINFSKSVGFRFPTGTTHTFFIDPITKKSDNIRSFYTAILHGETPDLSDSDKFTVRKKNSGYNIIF